MIGWRAAVLAAAVAGLTAAVGGLYLAGRRDAAEAMAPRLAEAEGRLAAAEASIAAQARLAEARSLALKRQALARDAVNPSIFEARHAEDGHAPLESLRADRLRRADDRLCQAAPDLDGCAAATAGGPGAVFAAPSAPVADPRGSGSRLHDPRGADPGL